MTAGPSGEALVRTIVSEVERILASLPDDVGTRRLRARAGTYQKVVVGWASTPATEAQVGAMLDLARELHVKVLRHVDKLRSGMPPE